MPYQPVPGPELTPLAFEQLPLMNSGNVPRLLKI